MKYAILENNIVVNIITATQEFIEQSQLNAVLWVDGLDMGDTYINGQTTKAEPQEMPILPVKMNRLKTQLYLDGDYNEWDSWFNAQNGIVKIFWLNTDEVDYYHPILQECIIGFGWTEERAKTTFRKAHLLP